MQRDDVDERVWSRQEVSWSSKACFNQGANLHSLPDTDSLCFLIASSTGNSGFDCGFKKNLINNSTSNIKNVWICVYRLRIFYKIQLKKKVFDSVFAMTFSPRGKFAQLIIQSKVVNDWWRTTKIFKTKRVFVSFKMCTVRIFQFAQENRFVRFINCAQSLVIILAATP